MTHCVREKQHCKSVFRNYKQLGISKDTCPEHPISRGIVLLVCSTYISVFGTNPNPLCGNLFCLSDAPPPHLQRTCAAPVTHCVREKQHCKSVFRNYKQLGISKDTCPEHPISRGIVLLVCSTYISVFGTNPNPLCGNLFCLSDAPPPHLQRTCAAPATHCVREKKSSGGLAFPVSCPVGMCTIHLYYSPDMLFCY